MPRAVKTPITRRKHSKGTTIRSSPAPSVASDGDDFDDSPSQPGPSTPSRRDLHQQTQLTTEEWYKSKNTQKLYASHVKGGMQFVKDWDAEHEEDEEDIQEKDMDGTAAASGRSTANSLRLGDAFEKVGEKTPMALRLYTADKCERLSRSFAVAEGTRSAFKLYFERCV